MREGVKRSKKMKKSDRYIKIVKWSEQDDCYVGSCPSLMLGGVHGDNEMKVYRELCDVVEEWIKNGELYGEALPKPDAANKFSGKFVLRVGADLHHALYLEALRNNESLNSYCVRTLEENHASPPRRRIIRRNDALAAK